MKYNGWRQRRNKPLVINFWEPVVRFSDLTDDEYGHPTLSKICFVPQNSNGLNLKITNHPRKIQIL